MLQKIRIQNFKLHKDTSLEIKPITLFIGQNNSGKSSIFQVLQLIKQNLKLRASPYNYEDGFGRRENLLIPPKQITRKLLFEDATAKIYATLKSSWRC